MNSIALLNGFTLSGVNIPDNIFDKPLRFFNSAFSQLKGKTSVPVSVVSQALREATDFHRQIESFGAEAYDNTKVQEVIKGFGLILGPYYIRLNDKQAKQLSKPVSDATLRPIADQVKNMTDDPADTDEWQREENTLFFKTARQFWVDYPKFRHIETWFKEDINGERINIKLSSTHPDIKAVVMAGADIIKTHPMLKPFHDHALEFRKDQAKFRITDVLGPLALSKFVADKVFNSKGLVKLYDTINKVTGVVTAAVVATKIPVLQSVIGKLQPAVQKQVQQTQQQEQPQQGPQPVLVQPGLVQPPKQSTANVVNTVLGVISAMAFAGLLVMGAKAQKGKV